MSPLKISRTPQVRPLGHVPRLDLVAIGFFSVLVLQIFRAPSHRWLSATVLEAVLLLIVPALVLWIASKIDRSSSVSPDARWIPLGVILFAAFGLLVQCVQRQVGLGDATEVVCLVVLQYAGWYMIIFSSLVPSYKNLGLVTCCCLVLFICFTSEQTNVLLAAFCFSALTLWHLLSNYWSKLDSKALDGQAKMLPINSIAIATSMIVIISTIAIASAIVPQNLTTSLSGFSPFSGGDNGGQDHFARAGVGDGNLLSAGQNATTTGPVETDQFIEDDKPSMYDLIVERSEPATEFKKLEKTRVVSIGQEAKHIEKIVESEQAGQAFRTSRKPPSDKVLDLENRTSDALFYVEGSTPVRFSVDSFQHFDGWDWTKVALNNDDLIGTKIRLRKRHGVPWYQNSLRDPDYAISSRAHRVKILRLKTDAVPSPPLHRAWHIDLVDSPSMFKFNPQGVLCMRRKSIPSHTVIDNVSDVPNFYILANHTTYQRPTDDSPFTQIPENDSKTRIAELAAHWTADSPKGWRQVNAIINHLRNEFTHDPHLVATETHSDSVASFLDHRGGPAYQFASVATQILRSAGYRTRLQRGFLVQPKDYDRVARQSVVTSENLHMWPEVCLDDHHWIPVEPTPGFPIPYNHLSAWQWCKVQVGHGIFWVKQHPIAALTITLAIALLTGGLVRFRLNIFTGACWMIWLMALHLFPTRQLTATRRLIDLRCWAAGWARPAFVPAPDWFSQLDPQAAKQFCHFWEVENFSRQEQSQLQRNTVAIACEQIVGELSFYRIKSITQTKANP